MLKNIFITGNPGVGKTTLVHTLLKELDISAGGFYTQEIRVSGKRRGFKIITLDGREGILASVDIRSPHRVGRYGVNLQDLEEIGVQSIVKALESRRLIVIDEVGKMELFSELFQQTLLQALDSEKAVLGTIMQRDNSFTRDIKKRGISTKVWPVWTKGIRYLFPSGRAGV
ncbi:TPA: NTPase [Candidatus Poribacteria bacterium]|nr:NTPase [Candidatus Poribacteria bacterium]